MASLQAKATGAACLNAQMCLRPSIGFDKLGVAAQSCTFPTALDKLK